MHETYFIELFKPKLNRTIKNEASILKCVHDILL